MKDKYRKATGKDVYANDMCCGCGGSDGSYSDEYVKWLESEVEKLNIPSVSNLPTWLSEDDVNIAKLYYQNGERLLAVKHLRDIANNHVAAPLKWAATFLSAYC
jgi:hypothetical protein